MKEDELLSKPSETCRNNKMNTDLEKYETDNINQNILNKNDTSKFGKELHHPTPNAALFENIKSTLMKKRKRKSTNKIFVSNTSKSKETCFSDDFASEVLTDDNANDELLPCYACRKEFQNAQDLKNHECKSVKTNSSVKKFKCKYCSVTFSQRNHFNNHMAGHEKNNCTFCNAHFAKRKALCKHLKSEHNIVQPERTYNCTFCEEKFYKKPHLIKHLKFHPEGQFVCYRCGFITENEGILTEHVREHLKQFKYDCELCGKKFIRKQQHDQHMRGHDRHSCSQCNITFSTKKLQNKHLQSVHHVKLKFPKKYCCSNCQMVFLFPQQLRFHMRTHTEENPIKCTHCEKSFCTNAYLVKHRKSARHLQKVQILEGKGSELKKRYECMECGARFFHQASLFRHMDHQHSKSEIFNCSHCDYSTNFKPNLKRHEESHSDIKRFTCQICGVSFRALATLKEHHAFLHSEHRNFACHLCDKSFKNKSMLQRHIKIHSENRPYKCHCEKEYKRLCHLKRHIAAAHSSSKSDYAPDIYSDQILTTDVAETDVSFVESLINASDEVSPDTVTSFTAPDINNSNKLDISILNNDVEEFLSSSAEDSQFINDVPSASVESLLKSINPSNDPQTTLVSLIPISTSESSLTAIPTNHTTSISLDYPNLDLSPSNFCNFNFTSSPIAENDSSTLQVSPQDIISFSSSADSLVQSQSLPSSNYQNQSESLEALSQLLQSTDSAGLQIPPFLLDSDVLSQAHLGDLNEEQSVSAKSFFGDSDCSPPLSPYSCNIQQNCSSDHLFSMVRDLDFWDSDEHSNSIKITNKDNFSTNLICNANNIMNNNMLFSNDSLMVCGLESSGLNSDLDTLANLC